MLASLYPKMTGFGALWRVDPVNVLLAPETPLAKTSKVHAVAAQPTPDVFAHEKQQHTQQKQEQQQQTKSRMSIHDRLRTLMGDMITETELEQRVRYLVLMSCRLRWVTHYYLCV